MIGSGRKLLESPLDSPDLRAWNATEFDSAARSRPDLNHEIFRSWNGRRIHLRDEAEDFGLRLSPPRSPHFYRSNYQSLSPPSRARAIASGQKELMDIVSHMPESCYELSLRDLVEQPMREETFPDERDFNLGGDRENRISKKESSRPLVGMENGGLYLKMGFPKSIGAKKTKKTKKKNDSALNSSAKVSPKPPLPADKDWWRRRRFSVLSESENVGYGSSVNNGSMKSSSSSSSSGSHGSSKNRTKSTRRKASGGCWSWIYPKYHEQDE